jgi:excisionase family DNA binding protein
MEPTLFDVDRLVSVNRAAELLGGLAPATIRKFIRNGKLPALKVGGRVTLKVSDLLAFITPRPVEGKK